MTTTMLYRPAEAPNPETWNLPLECKVFADEDIDQALTEGWVRHPSDLEAADPAEGKKPGRKPKAADPAEG